MKATILLSLFAATYAVITDCGWENSVFEFQSGTLTPDPPVLYKDFYVAITLKNNGPPVTNGTIAHNVYVNGFQVYTDVTSLCDYVECPIDSGVSTLTMTGKWSHNIGKRVSIKSMWYDDMNNVLLCARTDMSFNIWPF